MLLKLPSTCARLIFLTGFLVVISAVSPAVSQSSSEAEPAESAPTEPFFEAVDVEIVNIDVWVTDKQDNPVEGLSKDDFVVLRDGQPVEITNFYCVKYFLS